MTPFVSALLALFALPVAFTAGYLLLLAALAVATARKAPPAPPSPPTHRFDVLVPSHDEEVGIADTVKDLLAVDYPQALFRVIVIADNCTDATAQKAREAGARVMERHDPTQRGKGYALRWAFEQLLAEGAADAFVVVDADTVVTKNLLAAFSARLALGAQAMQADYGVRNPGASWRTRLMTIALALFHRVRGLGREALRVSCGLHGNGMGFAAALLREVPHDAFSLVEDLEYGVRLGQRGHRVWYVDEARVHGEMVSGEKASRSQRHRWEHGRRVLARTQGWPMLFRSLAQRSLLQFDLAMDVLIPPLSRVVALAFLGLVASLAALYWLGAGAAAVSLFAFACVALGGYVLAGWAVSGTGLKGLLDLAFAPAYVLWKVTLVVRGQPEKKKDEWVRTTREGETRP